MLVASLLAAVPAAAQQRPLVTQDPEVVGAGMILVEAGFDYQHDLLYPLSGLKGNLTRIPLLGLSFGIGSIAELQITGGPFNHLSITQTGVGPAPLASAMTVTGDTTHDVEDIVVATKIRVKAETPSSPGFGIRFATRLPNSKHESGLGLDTTEFHFDALVGKTVQSVRVVGNIGWGNLPDPTRAGIQNDVLDYGISVARAVKEGVEVVGEINGRASTAGGTPPAGTESRAMMRLGGRFTRGATRVDAGLLVGMTSFDPSFGFTAGVTYVFKGFDVK